MRNNRTILLRSLLVFAFILVACDSKTEGGLPDGIEFRMKQLGDVCTFVIEGLPPETISSFEVSGNQHAPTGHADPEGNIEGGWVVLEGETCTPPEDILTERFDEDGQYSRADYVLDQGDKGKIGDGRYGYSRSGQNESR